jgi:hypothetical protein
MQNVTNIFNPRHYLPLTAVVLSVFSAGLLIMPGIVMRAFNITDSVMGSVFIQFLGASLAGHAYLNWQARRAAKPAVELAVTMNIVALLAALIVSLLVVFHGTYTRPGLLIMLMHTAFLSGFLVTYKRIR